MNKILSRILTGPFLMTVLRYALAAAGFWLVSEHGFDPGKWEVISGALLTLGVTFMGGAEAVKDKVVINGKSVAKSSLPASEQRDLTNAAATGKSRSLWQILIGR